jgi:p-aminobenzoyl-glutamate transporter AbgT
MALTSGMSRKEKKIFAKEMAKEHLKRKFWTKIILVLILVIAGFFVAKVISPDDKQSENRASAEQSSNN